MRAIRLGKRTVGALICFEGLFSDLGWKQAMNGAELLAVMSVDDWFMGTTGIPAGIPPEHKALTATFRYNNLDSVHALFAAHPGRIACLMLEASRTEEPRDDFLKAPSPLHPFFL